MKRRTLQKINSAAAGANFALAFCLLSVDPDTIPLWGLALIVIYFALSGFWVTKALEPGSGNNRNNRKQ